MKGSFSRKAKKPGGKKPKKLSLKAIFYGTLWSITSFGLFLGMGGGFNAGLLGGVSGGALFLIAVGFAPPLAFLFPVAGTLALLVKIYAALLPFLH